MLIYFVTLHAEFTMPGVELIINDRILSNGVIPAFNAACKVLHFFGKTQNTVEAIKLQTEFQPIYLCFVWKGPC